VPNKCSQPHGLYWGLGSRAKRGLGSRAKREVGFSFQMGLLKVEAVEVPETYEGIQWNPVYKTFHLIGCCGNESNC